MKHFVKASEGKWNLECGRKGNRKATCLYKKFVTKAFVDYKSSEFLSIRHFNFYGLTNRKQAKSIFEILRFLLSSY